jgi:hypothetical protein
MSSQEITFVKQSESKNWVSIGFMFLGAALLTTAWTVGLLYTAASILFWLID